MWPTHFPWWRLHWPSVLYFKVTMDGLFFHSVSGLPIPWDFIAEKHYFNPSVHIQEEEKKGYFLEIYQVLWFIFYFKSFCHDSKRKLLLLSLKARKRRFERFISLIKIVYLVHGSIRVWTQVPLTPKPLLIPLYHADLHHIPHYPWMTNQPYPPSCTYWLKERSWWEQGRVSVSLVGSLMLLMR